MTIVLYSRRHRLYSLTPCCRFELLGGPNSFTKCFISRDAATLWRAFVVYVRPLLEYATCVPSVIIQRDFKNYATQCDEAGMAVSRLPGQSCHVVK